MSKAITAAIFVSVGLIIGFALALTAIADYIELDLVNAEPYSEYTQGLIVGGRVLPTKANYKLSTTEAYSGSDGETWQLQPAAGYRALQPTYDPYSNLDYEFVGVE